MDVSLKRAAVVVPTAFLVAVSGLVAAPAVAAPGDQTSPQADVLVPGRGEYVGGSTYTGPAGTYKIKFRNMGGGTTPLEFPDGDYWVQIKRTPAATGVADYLYVDRTVAVLAPDEPLEVLYDLVAGAAKPGDVYELSIADGEGVKTIAYDGNEDGKKDYFATLDELDKITITIEATVPVSVAPGSATSFEQGVTGQINYLNLRDDKFYIAATAGRVITANGATLTSTLGKATLSYMPRHGESGSQAVRLFEVDTSSAAWAEAETADAAAAGANDSAHRLAVLKNTAVAKQVHSHAVTVKAVAAEIRVSDSWADPLVGATASDRRVRAGDTVSLDFVHLPKPAVDKPYVLTRSIGGAAAETLGSIDVVDSPAGSGLVDLDAAPYDDAVPASAAGKSIVYTLTSGSTKLTTTVAVARPTARLTDVTKTAIFAGETGTGAVTIEGVDGDRYYVVTSTTIGSNTTQTVAAFDATAPTVDVPTTEPAKVSYQLYYVPEGLGMTATFPTEQVAWLTKNAVAQFATPFVVQVGAVDARLVSKPVWKLADHSSTTLDFTFENLDKVTVPATSKFYVWVSRTDADGTKTEYLANDAHVTPTGNTTVKYAIPGSDLKAGQSYTVTLYHGEENIVANYAEGKERDDAAKRFGAVKSKAGATLSATSVEETKVVADAKPSTPTTPTRPSNPGGGGGSTPTTPTTPSEPADSPVQLPGGASAPDSFARIPAGTPGHQVLVGDWDGDGVATPGYRQDNRFFLAESNAADTTFTEVAYGKASDIIYVGDWDGDGVETLAVRRGNEFHLSNSFAGGPADTVTAYGRADDVVLIGDWDGDGVATPSVRRGNEFHLKNDFSGGDADVVTAFGRATDEVVVGDWDGNGSVTPGVRRGATFYLKNDFSGGEADETFDLGEPGDTIVVGAYTPGSAKDTIGVYRPSTN